MTGETHRAGGMLCATAGFVILRQNGLLLPNCNEFVQLVLIYPFCLYGSVFSDLDHDWDCSPMRDPLSRIVNAILHLTSPVFNRLHDSLSEENKRTNLLYLTTGLFGAKHRSWQTHSDLTLIAVLFLLWSVMHERIGIGVLTQVDSAVITLCLTGFALGIVAHFILDMLTPSGVWCMVGITLNWLMSIIRNKTIRILPEKIHIVPPFRIFSTGGNWETLVRFLVRMATTLQVAYIFIYIVYPQFKQFIPFEITIGG